jgi:hypothetical protein
MTHHPHHTAEMDACIRACRECSAVCTDTIRHCLTMGGDHAAPDHIALMQTCAAICTTDADAMARGTPGHEAICAACAEICRRCAESCERLGSDEAMKRCADASRRCERTCREMAAA